MKLFAYATTLGVVLILLVALSQAANAQEAAQIVKKQCQMCTQMMFNGVPNKEPKYLCPVNVLKTGDCSFRLGDTGKCCADGKKHPSCVACSSAKSDEPMDDDDDDDL